MALTAMDFLRTWAGLPSGTGTPQRHRGGEAISLGATGATLCLTTDTVLHAVGGEEASVVVGRTGH